MKPHLLLDTHILVRWLIDSKRLSRSQTKAIETAVQRGEPIAISAITLLEIAILTSAGKLIFAAGLDSFLNNLRGNPIFRLLPLSYEVALEIASLGILNDPADRTIVSTARLHQLRLVTSDQRIVESKLASVVE
ncbi:MAG TPA: type II toxin-antitoxin system VapC family toxin [Bryobacteraceae bacterium]|nr:type II toxin-antitoxin system VapC family toxin [Bryobacteraceae bacterium]